VKDIITRLFIKNLLSVLKNESAWKKARQSKKKKIGKAVKKRQKKREKRKTIPSSEINIRMKLELLKKEKME
jgi:hypothetical protein